MPIDDGSAYIVNGVKLWGTNGVIADLLVVMAKVPKSEGHRGGITAFVVEADTPGITVERRNAFLGKRSHDTAIQRRLWTVSEQLTGVTFPAALRPENEPDAN